MRAVQGKSLLLNEEGGEVEEGVGHNRIPYVSDFTVKMKRRLLWGCVGRKSDCGYAFRVHLMGPISDAKYSESLYPDLVKLRKITSFHQT